MTVQSIENRVSYAGDGSTIVFGYPIYFILDTDIKVLLVDDDTGVETEQVLNTDYSILNQGGQQGGNVTMVTAPTVGETLIIYQDPSLTQNLDLTDNDPFPAEDNETALDRLTKIDIRTRELLEGVLRVSEGEGEIARIPARLDRAGKYAFWLSPNGELSYTEQAAVTLSSADTPIFPTKASVTLVTIPAEVLAFNTLGLNAAGDAGAAAWRRVDTEPALEPKVRSTDRFISDGSTDLVNGGWWEYAPKGSIRAGVFGFLPGATDTANGAAAGLISSYMNQSGNKSLLIQFGEYDTDTGFVFDNSNCSVNAHGALITYTATTGTLVEVNSAALSDESVISNNFRWFGGRLECSTPATGGGNSARAFRIRGITRAKIADVFLQDWGDAAIEAAPRDQLYLERIEGFLNGTHIRVPSFIDASRGNPQNVFISGIGLSIFYDYGIDIQGGCSHLVTRDGYIIPDSSAGPALRMETSTGSGGVGVRDVDIEHIDFEQGVAGDPYIQILNTHGIIGRSFNIQKCSFADSATKAIEFTGVDGLDFSNNYVACQTAGWMTELGSCKNIHVGANSFPALSQVNLPAITYTSDRVEFNVYPYVMTLENSEGVLTGFGPGNFATGDAAIDMSTALGSNFYSMIDPLGYVFNGEVRDSGSAAGTASVALVPDATVAAADEWRHLRIDLSGDPNNRYTPIQGVMIRATGGDVYRRFVASGDPSTTLSVGLKVSQIVLGRGKITA